MGRSFLFECPRCGYKANVAGRADGGMHFGVQTVVCRECKELYDVVTRLRTAAHRVLSVSPTVRRPENASSGAPPRLDSVVNRLSPAITGGSMWTHFNLACPVSQWHRVQSWKDPGKCPRCGTFLERNALPFRLWE